MIVKSARDVGIGATVRVAHPSGRVFEDRVLAIVSERLILETGSSVDPRKQYVKVIGFGQFWRAVEESERDLKAGALSSEDRLGHPAHQLPVAKWPGYGT